MKWLFVISVALVGACGDREAASSRRSVTRSAMQDRQMRRGRARKRAEQRLQSTPKSQRIAREMLNCLAELYEAERPTTDPDAEP